MVTVARMTAGMPKLLAVLLCAGVLMGCSEQAEPVTLPSTLSPPASPKRTAPLATAKATTSVTPANQRGAAAEQAVRIYWKQVNRALVTSDATALRKLHAESCALCRNVERVTAAARSKSRRVTGSEYRVDKAKYQSTRNDVDIVMAVISSAEGALVDNEGKVVDTYPAGPPTPYAIQLQERKGAYTILRMDALPR